MRENSNVLQDITAQVERALLLHARLVLTVLELVLQIPLHVPLVPMVQL
jgi:hypothetical protein